VLPDSLVMLQALEMKDAPSFPGAPEVSRASLEAAARDYLRHVRRSARGQQDTADAEADSDEFDFLDR
jgi:hypothetical protein